MLTRPPPARRHVWPLTVCPPIVSRARVIHRDALQIRPRDELAGFAVDQAAIMGCGGQVAVGYRHRGAARGLRDR